MGWAERCNPRSWRNSTPLVRMAYAAKNAARDRKQFEEAMSSEPIMAGLGVVPKAFQAFAAMMTLVASRALYRGKHTVARGGRRGDR